MQPPPAAEGMARTDGEAFRCMGLAGSLRCKGVMDQIRQKSLNAPGSTPL
jgi:hypothetical protein